ncbi:MAG: PilZ domain-containing protein [Desulfobacterales bacterium]
MENINTIVVYSIAVAGAIFVGLVLFWFVSLYLKKRVGPEIAGRPAAVLAPRGPWDEKRAHPRLSVSWHASIPTPHGPLAVQLRDISQGGAFVVCAAPLALSERLQITIAVPGRPGLTLTAEVVWSNANVSTETIVNRGMGIRFVENDSVRRQALAGALSLLMAAPSPRRTETPRTTPDGKAG